jgi:hypothetical protein
MAGLLLTLLGCGMLARASLADGPAPQTFAAAPPPVAASAPSSEPASEPVQCGPDPARDEGPPPPPAPAEALRKGVLIVVSLASQKLYVFKDGARWGSTTISTGRAGHGTPAGTFTILQKRVRHRSNIYSGAPMPYMQRLTWGGIALHAGHVTGRPASHGCIRLPWDFARQLFALTNPAATSVLIVKQPLDYADAARSAASGAPWQAPPVRQARTVPAPPSSAILAIPQSVLPSGPPSGLRSGPQQTIQLAAASNPQGADDLWQELSATQPELQALNPVIVPATVRSVQVYRLRASGAQAHAICSRLVARGVACMKVTT